MWSERLLGLNRPNTSRRAAPHETHLHHVGFLQHDALEFSEVKSREVMIPRTELIAVEIHDSITALNELFTSTGYSKILVYKNTIDDILGYVHSFELFKNPKSIKSIMLPVEFVPETMLIKDVLNSLTKKRKSVAVVLDEYGGTSGIMTVEDIVEELFGEIEDEHDTIELLEEKINKTTYNPSVCLQITEKRSFCSSKSEKRHRGRNAYIYSYHTRIYIILEFSSIFS